jgi:hypothetical protein
MARRMLPLLLRLLRCRLHPNPKRENVVTTVCYNVAVPVQRCLLFVTLYMIFLTALCVLTATSSLCRSDKTRIMNWNMYRLVNGSQKCGFNLNFSELFKEALFSSALDFARTDAYCVQVGVGLRI